MDIRGNDIKFRENWAQGTVAVIVGGVGQFASVEYVTAAEWAKRKYDLTDAELMRLYGDYKEDYDAD